jgi:cell fate regulator YaaT (PSP1 superfamily)
VADYYNVKFKGERKQCYLDDGANFYQVGDFVLVEAEKGEDLGVVAQKRLKEPAPEDREEIKKIKRKATPEDIAKIEVNRNKEKDSFVLCSKKIVEHNLVMKLVDVEFQYDGNKITFFFTAEKRIDFRSLVKDLASFYNTRIELRQIGVRDEARRIGGYGHCGVALCCASFKDEFEPVTTKMARDQLLSVNPRKLSGACGRLMCCLEYEYNFYTEELAKYPAIGSTVHTTKGEAIVDHVDIFKGNATLHFHDDNDEVIAFDALQAMLVPAPAAGPAKPAPAPQPAPAPAPVPAPPPATPAPVVAVPQPPAASISAPAAQPVAEVKPAENQPSNSTNEETVA